MINVMYSCDQNYLCHAAASIVSLLENNKKENIKIFLICNDLNPESMDKLEKLVSSYHQEIVFLDIQLVCEDVKKNDNFPLSGYARLFIDQIVDVDKILYLDCDTIVLNSITELYHTNIENYYVAGVQDAPAKILSDIIGMDENDRYINSGILLINLKKWKEDKLRSRYIEFIEQYDGKVPHHDQGIVNGVCKNKIKILSPKYNFMPQFFLYTSEQAKRLFNIKKYYTQKEIDSSKKSPVVIHFIAKFFGRPWEADCTHPYKNEYLNYLKMSGFYKEPVVVKRDIGLQLRKFFYYKMPYSFYYFLEKLLDVKREKHLLKNYKNVVKK